MLDFNVEETLSKMESPLKEKVTLIDGIREINNLDSSIAKFIEVKERIGRFSENPTIEGVRSWIKEINPNYDPYDMESPYNVNCGVCICGT